MGSDTTIFILNLVGYYLIYLLGTFLFGGVSGGYTFVTLLFMCCGLANYCVVCFRSSPIVPWDIYSIRTAVSVADNYNIDITGKLIGVVLGFLVLTVLGRVLPGKVKKLLHSTCGTGTFDMLCIWIRKSSGK